MSRRKKKGRKRRSEPPAEIIVLLPDEPMMDSQGAGWWGLAKAMLICGLAGGLVGGAIDAALRAGGHASTAALVGGIPAGMIGACALGWYGRIFGAMNRLRHGMPIGAALGLLGAGTLGMVAGLSVWALFWSVPGAIVGALIHSALTRRERRMFGLWPGVVIGALVGIFLRAVRTGPPEVMTDAIDGALVGAVLGVLLIPALLAWITRVPEVFRRRRRGRW